MFIKKAIKENQSTNAKNESSAHDACPTDEKDCSKSKIWIALMNYRHLKTSLIEFGC